MKIINLKLLLTLILIESLITILVSLILFYFGITFRGIELKNDSYLDTSTSVLMYIWAPFEIISTLIILILFGLHFLLAKFYSKSIYVSILVYFVLNLVIYLIYYFTYFNDVNRFLLPFLSLIISTIIILLGQTVFSRKSPV